MFIHVLFHLHISTVFTPLQKNFSLPQTEITTKQTNTQTKTNKQKTNKQKIPPPQQKQTKPKTLDEPPVCPQGLN